MLNRLPTELLHPLLECALSNSSNDLLSLAHTTSTLFQIHKSTRLDRYFSHAQDVADSYLPGAAFLGYHKALIVRGYTKKEAEDSKFWEEFESEFENEEEEEAMFWLAAIKEAELADDLAASLHWWDYCPSSSTFDRECKRPSGPPSNLQDRAVIEDEGWVPGIPENLRGVYYDSFRQLLDFSTGTVFDRDYSVHNAEIDALLRETVLLLGMSEDMAITVSRDFRVNPPPNNLFEVWLPPVGMDLLPNIHKALAWTLHWYPEMWEEFVDRVFAFAKSRLPEITREDFEERWPLFERTVDGVASMVCHFSQLTMNVYATRRTFWDVDSHELRREALRRCFESEFVFFFYLCETLFRDPEISQQEEPYPDHDLPSRKDILMYKSLSTAGS